MIWLNNIPILMLIKCRKKISSLFSLKKRIGQNGLKCRKETSVKTELNLLRKLKMLRMDQGKVSKNPFHQNVFNEFF